MSWTKREPEELELSTELRTAVDKLRAKSPLCPSPDLLQAAQAGVLPPDLAKDVSEHLERCGLCKSLQADLEVLDNEELDNGQFDVAAQDRIWSRVQAGMAPQKAPAVVAARSPWWKLGLRPLPVAAMAAAAVLVLVLGVRWFGDRQQPAPSVAQNQRPALPLPPSVFRLEKAPVVLPASTAILWRGQEDPFARQSKDLQQALVPYAADNYAEAARRLDLLRKKYPRMAEAPFYLGVSQLFLNQNDDAAKSLKDAVNLADRSLADEATWYLALALDRTGRTDLARPLLEQLCRAGRKNSNRACTGVKELQSPH
jgi:tetratricopeptide (TPR) repeat protein